MGRNLTQRVCAVGDVLEPRVPVFARYYGIAQRAAVFLCGELDAAARQRFIVHRSL